MPTISDQLREEAQRLADLIIPQSRLLAGLIDQRVADTLISQYFRSLPGDPPGTRHMVDVGACYGSVSAPFLQQGWTVDMFEPDPACLPILNRLIALYPNRCRLFAVAAAREGRDVVTFQQNTTPGLSGLAESPFGSTRRSIPTRAVRLGEFLPAQGIERVDFLKIDTEGNDFEVLEGYDFERLPPAIVFVEYSFFFQGQTAQVLQLAIDAMATRGFSAVIFDYEDDGNFQRGSWEHRLVEIHMTGGRLPQRKQSFGNVLFYQRDDNHLLRTIIALMNMGR